MSEKADIVIFGSGFAGSIMACILRRLGRSVILVEKAKHPRFAIGESSTPLANLILEQLANDYGLPELKQLSTWGSWQKHFPQLACGLKRGFTFVRHEAEPPSPQPSPIRWEREPEGFVGLEGPALLEEVVRNALLVAASPADEVADTHWFRADFDHYLAKLAVAQGAELLEETSVSRITQKRFGWEIKVSKGCKSHVIEGGFLIDATGPCGVLANHFQMERNGALQWIEPHWSIYSHFKQVERFDQFTPAQTGGAGYEGNDGALHHVFDGGWIWVLRFNNGITSAGAVLNDEWQGWLKKGSLEDRWKDLLIHFPDIQAQFRNSIAAEPFRQLENISWRADICAGTGWAMLPSAAGFIDPLLSTGFPLALLGVERLASFFKSRSFPSSEHLKEYERITFLELETTELLVAAMFKAFNHLESLTQLSLLYFAAASYSETIQRLDPDRPKPGFLLVKEMRFIDALRRICQKFLEGGYATAFNQLSDDVKAAIEPYDVAGLTKPNLHRCYPVNFEDLRAAGPKLGASPAAIEEMIQAIENEIRLQAS